MRLAVVGTHSSGKTTLVEDFIQRYPSYVHGQEPYHGLLDAGESFSDPPDFDDFLSQIEFSIETVMERSAERDVIFDRCPLDLLAYAEVVGRNDGRSIPDTLQESAEEAIRTLELIAFLPLSSPDEIDATPDYPKLRARVDRRLKQIIRGDEWGLFDANGPAVVELTGSPAQRLAELIWSLRP